MRPSRTPARSPHAALSERRPRALRLRSVERVRTVSKEAESIRPLPCASRRPPEGSSMQRTKSFRTRVLVPSALVVAVLSGAAAPASAVDGEGAAAAAGHVASAQQQVNERAAAAGPIDDLLAGVSRTLADLLKSLQSLLPGMTLPEIKLPTLPNLPTIPDVPPVNLPTVPDLPDVPDLPGVPDVPGVPDLPGVPDVPIPDLPLPDVSVPDVQTPKLPVDLPVADPALAPVGTAPGTPSIPGIPDVPAVPDRP
ncbi:hypothetical protein SSAG_05789 [Streptomyces sp. Mg1]|nr:hypothetical protein SSAG_05789 [Streptomyces sp. Mg1]